jgi:hypothetical protein
MFYDEARPLAAHVGEQFYPRAFGFLAELEQSQSDVEPVFCEDLVDRAEGPYRTAL